MPSRAVSRLRATPGCRDASTPDPISVQQLLKILVALGRSLAVQVALALAVVAVLIALTG
jgi:hypothetical protein